MASLFAAMAFPPASIANSWPSMRMFCAASSACRAISLASMASLFAAMAFPPASIANSWPSMRMFCAASSACRAISLASMASLFAAMALVFASVSSWSANAAVEADAPTAAKQHASRSLHNEIIEVGLLRVGFFTPVPPI